MPYILRVILYVLLNKNNISLRCAIIDRTYVEYYLCYIICCMILLLCCYMLCAFQWDGCHWLNKLRFVMSKPQAQLRFARMTEHASLSKNLQHHLLGPTHDLIFSPCSRAFFPTVRKDQPDGVSFCPENHPQPLFFTPQSHTPFGDMYG